MYLHYPVGIFLAKEPKVTQKVKISVLLHISTTKCYGVVTLGTDLEPTHIAEKIPWICDSLCNIC